MTDVEQPASVPSFGGFGKYLSHPTVFQPAYRLLLLFVVPTSSSQGGVVGLDWYHS